MAIEEELSLRIEDALAAIDQVAKSLTDAATTFFVAMDDALKAISANPVALPIEAAFTEVEGGDLVQAAIGDEQETSLTFTDVDADAVRTGTQDSLDSVTPDPIQIPIDGDASALGEAVSEGIQGASGDELIANIFLESVNPTQPADEVKAALEEEDFTVTPTADLSLVKEEYSAFAEQVQGGTEPVFGGRESAESAAISKSLGDTAENAKKAKEEISATTVVATGLAFGLKGAAAAGTAAFAAISAFFAAAVESESVAIGFQRSLGSLAPAIANIDAAGLNIQLEQLAENLGSDDEAALLAAQRFAMLGKSSGAAAQDIAEANSNLFAVAANIRSLNPNAGELADIANRLSTGFARGGRALAGTGIALTSTEIKLRAAQMTGKATTDTFNQFELAAAGADLAVQQLGSSIETNIDAALDNPVIALANLRQIFANLTEELGAPIVAPVLELIRELFPIALSLTTAFGDFAQQVVPLAENVVAAFLPILTTFTDIVAKIIDETNPAFEAFGYALVQLLEAATPTLNVLAELAGFLTIGFADSLAVIASLIGGIADNMIGPWLIAIFAVYRGFKLLDGVLTTLLAPGKGLKGWLTVIGIAGAAIATLSGYVNQSVEGFKDFNQQLEEGSGVASDTAMSVDLLISKLEDYVRVNQVLNNENLVRSLGEVGVTIDDFSRFVTQGTEGIRQYMIQTAMLDTQDWGYFTVGGERIALTADAIKNLDEATLLYAFNNRNTAGAANLVADELERQSQNAQKSVQLQYEQIAASGKLSEEWKQQAIARASSNDGIIDYTYLLRLANDEVARQEEIQKKADIQSGKAAADLRALAEAQKELSLEVALGITTQDNFAEALLNSSLTEEQAKKTIEEVTAAIEDFTSTVLNNVPSVTEAFQNLGQEEGGSFDQIAADLEKNLEDTRNWSTTLVRLAQENKTGILTVATQVGAERTAILLNAYGGDEAALDAHLRQMLLLEAAARVEAEVAAKISFLQQRGLYAGNYEALAQILRDKAPFGSITREDLAAALQEVETTLPAIVDGVATGATDAGNAWTTNATGAIAGGVTEAGQEWAKGITGGVAGAAPQAGTEAATALLAAINGAITSGATNVAANLIFQLSVIGSSALPNSGLQGGLLGQRFVNTFNLEITEAQDDMLQTINSALLFLASNLIFAPAYVGFIIATGIGRGVFNSRTVIGDEVVNAFTFVVENYSDEADMTGWYLGDALIEGLKRGLRDGAGEVGQIAAEIIAGAEQKARDEAQSDSPSRVWENIGKDLVSGLTRGLETGTPAAFGAASSLMQRVNSVPLASGGNTSISVNVPVTINGNADPAMGAQIGRAAAVELRRVLQLEARMA